jgi:hypothetical protein
MAQGRGNEYKILPSPHGTHMMSMFLRNLHMRSISRKYKKILSRKDERFNMEE